MLYIAQRVRSPEGMTGINVYTYTHPDGYDLENPETGLGFDRAVVLQSVNESIPAGGNTILSFLDFVAPSDLEMVQVIHLRNALDYFRKTPKLSGNQYTSSPYAAKYKVQNIFAYPFDEVMNLMRRITLE